MILYNIRKLWGLELNNILKTCFFLSLLIMLAHYPAEVHAKNNKYIHVYSNEEILRMASDYYDVMIKEERNLAKGLKAMEFIGYIAGIIEYSFDRKFNNCASKYKQVASITSKRIMEKDYMKHMDAKGYMDSLILISINVECTNSSTLK